MPPVSAPARSMCGPRRLTRLALLLLSALVSTCIGAAPGWGQPASPAGGVTIGAGGEEASVVADQIQQVGGISDLLIAVGNVEITRGQSRLLADPAELTRATGQAVARGTGGVSPWVRFFAAALRRERQSGFLFPEFEQSSRKGFFTRVPYFWAIDDSQDLTVTIDAFSRRGLGLEGQYRYVLSREQRGDLNVFGVNEALRSDVHARVPENRGWGSFHHDWQITPRLSFKVNANVVSDDLIFRDYGNRLQDRATQRAQTNVFLPQAWDAWSFVATVKWYHDLTPTPRRLSSSGCPTSSSWGSGSRYPGFRACSTRPMRASSTSSAFSGPRVFGPTSIRASSCRSRWAGSSR